MKRLRIIIAIAVSLIFFNGNAIAGDSIRLIDGSFNADEVWNQSLWFTPPSDGKLVMKFKNPDASADGKLYLYATNGWSHYPNRLMDRPLLSGYALYPGFTEPIYKGFKEYELEFNIYENWGKVKLLVYYGPKMFSGGTDNTGVDSVTIDFVPERIEDLIPEAQFVTSIVSGPKEMNEVSVEFNAPAAGKLILEATHRGSGGGGHMVYLDENCIGGSHTGEFDKAGPLYKTVPVREAGHYLLTVRHEDSVYWDNWGQRGVKVYYIPTEIPNQPPVADAGIDQREECVSYDGAAVTLNGSGSSDADGDPLTYKWTGPFGEVTGINPTVTLPLGTHDITLVVNDGKEDSAPDNVTVTVNDTIAPTVILSVSPQTLWPPNHRYVDINSTLNVVDACDANPSVTAMHVNSSEADDATGDGKFVNDIIIENGEISLRAERSGNGIGRIYTISYIVSDMSGNSASTSAIVNVPHSKKK